MVWPFGRKSSAPERSLSNLDRQQSEQQAASKLLAAPSEFELDPQVGATRQSSIKVLFVCTGNICRSASGAVMAKAARNDGLSNWRVDSAGTGAVVGHGIDADIATALNENEIPGIGDHVAKQLNYRLLEAADVIIIFDESHFRWILHEAPQVVEKIFPLGKLTTLLEHGPKTLEEVKRENLKVPTRSEHWIEDPYRQGLEAARSCVAEIKRDLGIVIANLK